MSECNIDQSVAIKEAREQGFKVFRSRPKWLLLDLDDREALGHYENMLSEVQEYIDVTEVRRWVSKSGFGTHVLLRSKISLPVEQRMLLQAILGSDLKRELYNLVRMRNGNPEPCLLFEPPQKRKPVTVKPLPVKPLPLCSMCLLPLDRCTCDDDVPF